MKTKLFFAVTFSVIYSLNIYGQLKVFSDGNTHIGSDLLVGGTWDGDFRVAITAEDTKTALATWTNHVDEYAYAHVSYVNKDNTKNWVVQYNEVDNFFVLGDGSIWSVNNYITSDSTLKTNIINLQDAKNKVLQLRGVSYNFKPSVLNNPLDSTTIISTAAPKKQIGLIAQEVEAVVPEVVETNDKGKKGIAYQNLVALLIEAFKEQNATIDSLKMQIENCCKNNSSSFRIRSENSTPKLNSEKSSVGRLDQNKPNPFTESTRINFFIPENSTGNVLMIFDMQGVLKKEFSISGFGEKNISISGGEFKAGMYLYTLLVNGKEIDTKRMILTK